MLHFPEEPGKHRNDLIFTPDRSIRFTVTVVFER